jgi:hypothetical protein
MACSDFSLLVHVTSNAFSVPDKQELLPFRALDASAGLRSSFEIGGIEC